MERPFLQIRAFVFATTGWQPICRKPLISRDICEKLEIFEKYFCLKMAPFATGWITHVSWHHIVYRYRPIRFWLRSYSKRNEKSRKFRNQLFDRVQAIFLWLYAS